MFVPIDLLALAANVNYFSTLPATSGTQPSLSFLVYNTTFESQILGTNATGRKVAESSWQAFHEGGVYHAPTNTMLISSNWAGSLSNPVNITTLCLDDYSWTSSHYPSLYEANGGTTYFPPGSASFNGSAGRPPLQLWCDEGDFVHPSSLVAIDPSTNTSQVLLTSFLGRNFSSPNDVRQHPVTGDLWFTDADYGYLQAFRPTPSQPKQVYRFEPGTGVIQVVADGFVQSNGLEFSPDLKTLYVTDTGASQGDLSKPGTIYAYDVVGNGKRLENRRIFAFADQGFPDGIHTDTMGNVWAGCADGVHVWNPDGILMGKIYVGEVSNNFAFIPGGVLVFTNYRVYLVENVLAQGRELCKDFGVGCS